MVASILTDFDFIQGKVCFVGVRELIEDYDRALAAGLDLPAESERALVVLRQALRASLDALLRDGTQTAGQLLARVGEDAPGCLRDLLARASRWESQPWFHPLVPTLRPPAGLVQALRFDGSPVVGLTAVGACRCASLGAGGTIHVWDSRSGDVQQTFVGRPSRFTCITADPHGRVLAAGCEDGTVVVWEVSSGRETCRFRAHRWEVNSVGLLPESAGVVTASGDGAVGCWDLPSGSPRAVLRRHRGWVGSAAVASDGRFAVSGSSDGTVRCWALPEGTEIGCFDADAGWANAVAVASGGGCVAGYEDGAVRLWDLERGCVTATLDGPSHWVGAVAFSRDGASVVSGSDDGAVRVWDVASARLDRTFEGHTTFEGHAAAVNDVAVLAGPLVASGADDGNILVWDLSAPPDDRAGGTVSTHGDCSPRRKADSATRRTPNPTSPTRSTSPASAT
jgi:hypothetical protein